MTRRYSGRSFKAFLREPLPSGKQLLLIVDGLDEAAWEIGKLLFPRGLGDGVRVFASARLQSGYTDARGWLKQLNWDQVGLAEAVVLGPLTKEGLGSVLASMGNPLDQFATEVDLLAQLHRLTEGDPLLVRFYVDALYEEAGQNGALTPEDLQSIEPGLEGYFDHWWKEQEKPWIEQGKGQDFEQVVQAFLNLCSGALGPLTKEDIEWLATDKLGQYPLEEVVREARRFIIGNDKEGYKFNHPRLNQYFWDRLGKANQKELTTRFLAYGQDVLIKLDENEPQQPPVYVLQWYGEHLLQAQKAGVTTSNELYRLVSNNWRKAWEAFEGTATSFLLDVDRAWEVAEKEHNLAMQVKCVLCHSSVVTLTTNIPVPLLKALKVHNKWTFAQALAMVRRDGTDNANVLEFIRSFASLGLSAEEYAQMLVLTVRINSHKNRADALGSLAPYLPERLLEQALDSATAIEPAYYQAGALGSLALRLPEAQQSSVYKQALDSAAAIEPASSRARALGSLAPHLPERLLEQALDAAAAIEDASSRARALGSLAPHLPKRLLEQALDSAAAVESAYYQARALGSLAPHLPERLLEQALDSAAAIEDDSYRADALGSLAPHLPERLLEQALDSAAAIEDASSQADALRSLVKILSLSQRRALTRLLSELLPDKHKGFLHNKMIYFLIEGFSLPLLNKAVRTIESQALTEFKSPFRLTFVSCFFTRFWRFVIHNYPIVLLLKRRLDSAVAIKDAFSRAIALGSLAPHLPERLLEQALDSAAAIKDAYHRAIALGSLAPHLPERLLEQALDSAAAIEDAYHRARALRSLAPHLPERLLEQALDSAAAIEDASSRADALRSLAPHLPERLLEQALDSAAAIELAYHRARALGSLAPHLPERLLEQALDSAAAVEDASSRANLLRWLALEWVKRNMPPKLLLDALLSISPRSWPPIKESEQFIELLYDKTAESEHAELWHTLLRYLSKYSRPEFLSLFSYLVPFAFKSLDQKEKDKQGIEVAKAIIEVGEWWP